MRAAFTCVPFAMALLAVAVPSPHGKPQQATVCPLADAPLPDMEDFDEPNRLIEFPHALVGFSSTALGPLGLLAPALADGGDVPWICFAKPAMDWQTCKFY